MAGTDVRQTWVRDSAILVELGQYLDKQMPLSREVRLPRSLALAVIASWDRDDTTTAWT
jgi:hypothetical protein